MKINCYDIAARLLRKKEQRLRTGWVDHHPLSHDYAQAMERAFRIFTRINKEAA